MPVTTRIISVARLSRRSANGICRSPDGSHVKTVCSSAGLSTCIACRLSAATTDTTNDASITAHATPPETDFDSLRPKNAFTRKPTRGRSGISSSMSPLQRRERIGAERLPVAEERNHERQPDGRLGRRDGHDEEHDDLPVDGAAVAADRHEHQVHRVQHDLDRQEDRDQVAAEEHAGGPDREQDSGKRQEIGVRDHGPQRSFRATTMAPTIATRISTDVTSNANACRVKSACPMLATSLISGPNAGSNGTRP